MIGSNAKLIPQKALGLAFKLQGSLQSIILSFQIEKILDIVYSFKIYKGPALMGYDGLKARMIL